MLVKSTPLSAEGMGSSVTKVKKGIEKKEEINYNIYHTHSGHDVGYRLRL